MSQDAGEKIRVSPDMGRRLRQAREQRGLTQTQVAQAVNACQQQIHHYESGNLDVAIDRLFDLARFLHISPADLFD